MSTRDRLRDRWKVLVAAVVVIVLLAVVGGPYVYIHFIEGPAPKALTVDSNTSGSGASAGSSGAVVSAVGTWTPGAGSAAGYRVKEVLFGQSTTAVGRTSSVQGRVTIAGTKVTAATFTVDMTTVHSDKGGRDGQFQGRIMDTSQFPTSSFTLSAPIDLGAIPAAGKTVTESAVGKLTLRGATHPVTFAVNAKRAGATIRVQGAIPITFGDWGIPNPTFGPARVGSSGTLEFLLVLRKSSGS